MRTLLAGEFTTATAGDTKVDLYGKLEVQNGSGTWIDVATAYGKPPVINGAGSEHIDTGVSQATFTIVQAIGAKSGAPLMSASVLNRLDDGVTYSPLFDLNRLVRFSVATMPIGVALDVTKYREVFIGRINRVSIADSIDWLGPVTLTCSDLGNVLARRQIETSGVQYGTSPIGTALQTVIQNILTATLPAGEPAVTLVKESASSFAVTNFQPDSFPKVFDALTGLVLDTTGEDLRYRYDASHVSQFMWFNPDRTRVTVDGTFAKDGYILQKLDLDLDNIRNAGAMPWSDPALGTTGTVTSTAAASIAKYFRSFFAVPASPMLATQATTQTVLDAIVSDLSVPPGEAIAILPYCWFVQLYDRYTFPANGRQYDQDQTFAVIGHDWSIVNGQGTSTLTLSGKILGAYAAWLAKITGGGGTSGNLPVPKITLAAQNPVFITVKLDATVDVGQRPFSWQYRLVGDVTGYSQAFSAPSFVALPVTVDFVRSTFKQASVELKITQADGTSATTSFPVQGQIAPAVHGAVGRTTEDDARAGTGGVPVSKSRLRPDIVYSDDGTTPLIDTVTRRFQTALSGPTGIGGDVIERGGNKGDGGFSSTTGDLVSTAKDSRAAPLNQHFRYGTDGPAGVIESGIQAFIHPTYTDTSRRPITIRDGATDVGANDINVGQQRARGGFSSTTGDLVSTAKDSRTSPLNTHFRYGTDSSDGILDGTGSPMSGGKRAQIGLNASNLLVTGVHASALGVDGYGNMESRRGIVRRSAHSSGAVTEGYNRGGFAGVPTRDGMFVVPPMYDATGTQLMVDPNDVGALTPHRSIGTKKDRAKMHQSGGAAQAVANNTLTTLNWDVIDFDSGPGAPIADTANKRFNIPTDHLGLWLLHARVDWANNATGYRHIRINSSTTTIAQSGINNAGGVIDTAHDCWAMVDDPAAGEWFEVDVQQTSGGNLTVQTPNTTFEIFRIW